MPLPAGLRSSGGLPVAAGPSPMATPSETVSMVAQDGRKGSVGGIRIVGVLVRAVELAAVEVTVPDGDVACWLTGMSK